MFFYLNHKAMKNYILLFTLLFTSAAFLNAQEKDNKLKNTKEETITKTVTVKGLTEETTETAVVEKENQIIKINETNVENQNEVYSTKKEVEVKEVKSKTVENKENTVALDKLKKKQEEEIEASKKDQLAKYNAKLKEKDLKKDDD